MPALGIDLCPPDFFIPPGQGGPSLVRKESPDQVVSGNALVDAADLVQSLVPGTYTYRVVAFWTTPAQARGIQVAMDFTGTLAVTRYYAHYSAPSATVGTSEAATTNAAPLVGTRGIVAPAINWLTLEGLLVAETAGDLQFQFASEVAAGTVTLKPGSFMTTSRLG